MFMRGGTSRGPFFLAKDLPADRGRRDRVLLAVMGSPDLRQIDGLGGADPLTSKVAIVEASHREDCDVDYLFAQVAIDSARVDTEPSCGNMLAGVGPFAIERGLVAAIDGETRLVVFNINTQSRIEAIVQTPAGRVEYAGTQQICGAPGGAAPIVLNFLDVVGSKTGALLPTGAAAEDIDGVTVSCVDAAVPMVLIGAKGLGVTGYETDELTRDARLMARLERIRREAGERMGLGDVAEKVVPKLAVLAPPRAGGTLSSRYFTPDRLHKTHAVTGAICVGCAALIDGSVAQPLAALAPAAEVQLKIEHPAGWLDVRLETAGNGATLEVCRAGVVRTARKIMDGEVYVPSDVWGSE
jgi:2-methylaconitate cis-trans-isomerase PrpF